MTPVEAIEALAWRWALPGGGMPAHQYVIFQPGEPAAEVLLSELRDRPEAYDAYFRGYQRPMRYLEIGGWRYWRTSSRLFGRLAHMLNRCTLDSVEPPRRVDQGAQPLPWDGPPWAPNGSAWPPGYIEERPGQWVYHRDPDPRMRACDACGTSFMRSPSDRPCPRCGRVPEGVMATA
jgi:hypothetical protein